MATIKKAEEKADKKEVKQEPTTNKQGMPLGVDLTPQQILEVKKQQREQNAKVLSIKLDK